MIIKLKRFLNKLNVNDYTIYKFLFFLKIRKLLRKNVVAKQSSKIIWTMWWEGEENAPILVKKCISSMRKNSPKNNVVVIDMYNYKNYINLPEYIEKKINKQISITHLSDIIRSYLLAKYGGAWLDATIYVSRKIPDYLFDEVYYSLHAESDDKTYYSKWKWASFLQFGKRCNKVSIYCRDMLLYYWKKYNYVLNYYLTDIIILSGYQKDNQIHNLIDNIDSSVSNHYYAYLLINSFENKYSRYEYNKILSSALFFKLSWKQNFKKFTSDNCLTNYGYFIDN